MKNDCHNKKFNIPCIARYVVFSIVIIFIGLLSGCGNEAFVKAKVSRPIKLDNTTIADTPVYINVKSETKSGGEALRLDGALESALASKGYNVVGNPKEAHLDVSINVLFANNLREAQSIVAAKTIGYHGKKAALEEVEKIAIQSTAMSLQGIPMGMENSATYSNNVGDAAKSGLIAGATMALIAGVARAATEDDIYRAIIDVEVKEKSTGGESGESKENELLVNPNDISVDSGADSGVHRTRVFAEAIGNGLTLQEALPMLQVASVNKIVDLLK